MENLTISALLDRARNAQGVESDYMLCKRSGLRPNSVSHWRNGHGYPDEKACQKLAELAGLDPDVLIAQVNALRANEPTSRAIWERIAARLSVASGTVATAILSVAFVMNFVAPEAHAESVGHVSIIHPAELTFYTSCIVLMVVFFWLLACNESDSMARATFPRMP